jgi:hypothetical protein
VTTPKRTAVPKFLLTVPVDDDLTWFINHAESACGQRSALPALVGMIETGGQTRGRPSETVTWSRGGEGVFAARDVEIEMSSADRRMLARPLRREVSRDMVLRRRWMRLGTDDTRARLQQALCEAYGVRSFPHETKQPLGQLAGVALMTRAIQGNGEKLLRLCRKHGQNAEALDDIRRDAAMLVREAVDAWRATAGEVAA